MTVAHVAGMPFEEWLGPIAIGGSGVVAALRVVIWRHLKHRPRPSMP